MVCGVLFGNEVGRAAEEGARTGVCGLGARIGYRAAWDGSVCVMNDDVVENVAVGTVFKEDEVGAP